MSNTKRLSMQPDRIVVRLRESVRLDRYLTSRLAQVSRSRIQRHIERGEVLVDGRTVAASHRLHGGEVITIPGLVLRRLDVASRPVPFRIVFEDDAVVVVDKPAGLLVHPVGGEFQETLLNGLHHHLSAQGEPTQEVGIVHRLDRLTSGLMVLTKRLDVRRRLARQVELRQIHRAYLGVTAGVPAARRGWVDLPIRRDPRRPTRMQAVSTEGSASQPRGTSHVSSSGYSNPRLDFRPRPARTHYVVLRRLGRAALLRLVLDTGRTHQIRVHLQALGAPLLGDPLYGPLRDATQPKVPLSRPALHASCLEFNHPTTGERLRFLARLPEDMRQLLSQLGQDGSSPASDRGAGM